MDENIVIGCRTVSTTSSIIGNACAIAGQYFMDKFPKGYFKKVHIAKSFTPLAMADECEVVFKSCPQTIYIMPTWNPGDLSYELPRWHKSNEFVFNNKKRYYTKVLEDWEHGTFIYSIPNRIKVNMQVRIKLQSYLQAMDVQNHLHNMFDIGGFRYLNDIRMQTEIPISLIKPICMKNGWDWNNKDDKHKLNEYLHKYSYNGIVEKKNLATGLPMYAFSYITNILLHFPDQPERSEDPKGLSQGSSYVDFSFTMEFSSPNNYIFEAKNLTEEQVNPLILEPEAPSHNLMYNIYLDVDYIMPQIGDKHLIYREEFIPDINELYDKLEFKELLEHNLELVIEKVKSKGFKLNKGNELVDVIIMAGHRNVIPEDYTVDWKNYVVTLREPMPNTTYTILIYVNMSKVNKIEQRMHSDDKYGIDDNGCVYDIEI